MLVINVKRFEWLQEYEQLDHDIKYLKWNLLKTQAELSRRVSGDLSNDHLVKGSKGARVEEEIARLEQELQWRVQAQHDLRELVSSFNGIEEQILRKKYIDGQTLEEIAEDNEVHYTLSYIRKKHAELHRRLDFLDKWDADKYELQVVVGDQLR
ncbi:HTH transcription regulator [Latilactobacillus phage TMW 1.1381 P1]|nr:HTH transcription regulator [Latilactobacillus phage TMW 1.1381 P1]